MGARWYEPAWATFVSRDSYSGMLRTPISLNRYTYAHANPLAYWDPLGYFVSGAPESFQEMIAGQASGNSSKAAAKNSAGSSVFLLESKVSGMSDALYTHVVQGGGQPTSMGGSTGSVFLLESKVSGMSDALYTDAVLSGGEPDPHVASPESTTTVVAVEEQEKSEDGRDLTESVPIGLSAIAEALENSVDTVIITRFLDPSSVSVSAFVDNNDFLWSADKISVGYSANSPAWLKNLIKPSAVKGVASKIGAAGNGLEVFMTAYSVFGSARDGDFEEVAETVGRSALSFAGGVEGAALGAKVCSPGGPVASGICALAGGVIGSKAGSWVWDHMISPGTGGAASAIREGAILTAPSLVVPTGFSSWLGGNLLGS